MAELPDDAIVVRGGVMSDLDLLREHADDSLAEDGVWALSVFCGIQKDGEGAESLVSRLCSEGDVKNNQIRLTTVGKLREAGFTLIQSDEPECHYNVILGSVPDQSAITRFVAAFEEPRRKP